MSKIDRGKMKENIAKGGKAALDLLLEALEDGIYEKKEEVFAEAIEIGIENTISALYEANVSDEEIIHCLNKFWGVSRDESIDRILYEKSSAPLREIRNYLKLKGLSPKEVQNFILSNNVVIKLKNPKLKEMRRNPEKLIKELQKVDEQ